MFSTNWSIGIARASMVQIKVRENGTFDYQSLEKWMQKHSSTLKDFFPETTLRKVSQCGQGQSNPTYILETESTKYILRKKPKGKLLPSAHQV